MIVWAIAFFLMGIVIYLAGPLLVSGILPHRYRRPLAMAYFKQAAVVADRPKIVERKHGGHTLIATDFKPEWGDEATMGERKSHWTDEPGLMGRLFTRPFGLVPERFSVILDPKTPEIGREDQRLVENGEHKIEAQIGDWNESKECHNNYVQLPKTPRLVSLHDARGVLGEAADPDLGKVAYEYTKKSQAGFQSRSIVEIMSFIMAFGAVYGLFWFFSSQGGGDSLSAVSIFLGAMPW